MGLFGGFFNYSKPGPGIAKDAPKKKTFFVFFETWFRNIWKLVLPSITYCFMSLFLLPFGFASTGITNITRNIARDKHSFGMSDFFETGKKNWKQSLIVGLINLIATGLIIFSIFFYLDPNITTDGILPTVCAGLSIAVFLIFSIMKYYIWLLLITFKVKIGTIYKNSFYFVFINLKNNIIIGLVSILYYLILYGIFLLIPSDFTVIIMAFITICFYPGFKNLLIQFCVFPAVKKHMIDPYYAAHPDADIELRRNLGLEVPEDEDGEDEDSVFNDNQLLPSDKEE